MFFYHAEGFVKAQATQNGADEEKARRATRICRASEEFNDAHSEDGFFFVARIRLERVEIGILARTPDAPDRLLDAYLKAVELPLEDVLVKETTFIAVRKMLNRAYMNDLTGDDDDVLEEFDLDDLLHRIDFGENLIKKTRKEQAIREAKRLLTANALIPEVERIYGGGGAGAAAGHPVHYLVQTDDHDTRRETCRVLIGSLCAAGRLRSTRYTFVDVKPDGLRWSALKSLYKAAEDGAVIVRYQTDGDAWDGDQRSGASDTIEKLCEIMKEHRNQVLTIFCLPRECTEVKEEFFKYLVNVYLVEVKEEFATGERARAFLKELASEQKLRPDKGLFAGLEEGKGYLVPDLRSMFDEWHDRKIKSAYPQYWEIEPVRRKLARTAPKGSDYDTLMSMIGLDEAKRVIRRALDCCRAQKVFADKGMAEIRPAMHMVFTGNPGTAKTTVARLFAGILRENGVLSKGKLIEVGRADLVGKYVGWTAPTIRRKFEEAKGSVLFIDEAYSLVDDRDGSYGDEAINTIVQEMENHRKEVAVIFAGYPDKMEQFLQKNPGLRSRIAFHVPFADYSTEELCRIAEWTVRQRGECLTAEACEKLAAVFGAARTQSDFGNGRFVRNVIEKAEMARASRLLAIDVESVGRKEVRTIRAEDIDPPPVMRAPEKRRIGF